MASMREVLTLRYLLLMSVVLAVGILLLWTQHRRRPLDTLLTEHLHRLGINVTAAMTMEEALAKLRSDNPDAAEALRPLIALYEEERFSPKPDASRREQMRRALRELEA